MTIVMLETEFAYFQANQTELVEKYDGKILVLIGDRIIGVYDTPLEAYLEAKKSHEPGTFMIQPCKAGSVAYTISLATPSLP